VFTAVQAKAQACRIYTNGLLRVQVLQNYIRFVQPKRNFIMGASLLEVGGLHTNHTEVMGDAWLGQLDSFALWQELLSHSQMLDWTVGSATPKYLLYNNFNKETDFNVSAGRMGMASLESGRLSVASFKMRKGHLVQFPWH